MGNEYPKHREEVSAGDESPGGDLNRDGCGQHGWLRVVEGTHAAEDEGGWGTNINWTHRVCERKKSRRMLHHGCQGEEGLLR